MPPDLALFCRFSVWESIEGSMMLYQRHVFLGQINELKAIQ